MLSPIPAPSFLVSVRILLGEAAEKEATKVKVSVGQDHQKPVNSPSMPGLLKVLVSSKVALEVILRTTGAILPITRPTRTSPGTGDQEATQTDFEVVL